MYGGQWCEPVWLNSLAHLLYLQMEKLGSFTFCFFSTLKWNRQMSPFCKLLIHFKIFLLKRLVFLNFLDFFVQMKKVNK